jgi:hypothetical protein
MIKLGPDEDYASEITDNFRIKQKTANYIIDTIKEKKVISEDELHDYIYENAWKEEGDEYGYHKLMIDREITEKFVSELKSAGYITGSRQKLRIAPVSGKKRR